MAQFPQGFSARNVAPQGNSSQLPISPAEGWPAVIVASEMKQTSGNANNGYLECTLQIIEGEHTGQQGPYRINLYNSNEKTVEIANRQLSALCHVCGNPDAVDSAQLHNIPFRVIVGYQKPKEGDTADSPRFTEVKGVLHIGGEQPGKATGAAQPAAPQAPPAPPQQPAAQAQAAPAGAAPWQPAAPAAAPAAAPGAAPWNPAPAAAQPAAAAPAWAAPQGAPGAAPWQR